MVVDWSAGAAERDSVARWLDGDAIAVANKIDKGGIPPDPWIPVSVSDGIGLDALLARIGAELAARLAVREAPVLTRERHRHAATAALQAIDRALTGLRTGAALELPAEDLRLAARALGRVTGKVDVEEILDVIFREFCLGK